MAGTRSSTGRSSTADAAARGGNARLVELGDWVGMPGAEAAEAARSMGFRPAMELVDAAGEPGVVVEQEPEAGTPVSRNCFVTLLIASNARVGQDADLGDQVEDDFAEELDGVDRESLSATVEEDEADERYEEELEADEARGWGLGGAGSSADARAVAATEGVAWSGRGDRAGREEAVTEELSLKDGPRLARVWWLLVIGGWRVLWGEAVIVAVAAVAAAWIAGGTAGLMGALAVVAVFSASAAGACLAATGGAGGRADGGAFGERRMVIDIEDRRRWPDGRFDAMRRR